MKEKMVRKETLENGETLKIFDFSRKISEDAFLVRMKAEMTVKVTEELFSSQEGDAIPFQKILEKTGPFALYEYDVERNFIMKPDKEAVFKSLEDAFFSTIVPYLSRPKFPKKLVLKKYND